MPLGARCENDGADVGRTRKAPDPRCSQWTALAMHLATGRGEPVAEIPDHSRLDLLDERVELEVRRCSVDLERGGEVEGAVGKVEMTSVYPSEAEMERGGCERRRGEVYITLMFGEGVWVEQHAGKVWGAGDENELM